ncbi:MAG TPA: septum formation family protein [Segeticoccus sp.]|nr:septum formation family protein [Segeticoccus sp.]
MIRRARAALGAAAVTLVAVAVGCSVGTPQAGPTHHPTASTAAPSPTPSQPPSPPPAPRTGSCHRLGFSQATSPTDSSAAVSCTSRHTSVTVAVGHFDPVRDGHLLTVDSRSVQQQIANRCPGTLAGYVGGSRDVRRLSRFTVVWFGPTLAQGEQGATWYRCDVVALAGRDQLAPLPPRLRGVLDRPHALARFGTCGTAAPDSPHFDRVICSHRHSWRAVSVVGLPQHTRLYARGVGAAADARCRQVAANLAHGALKYSWAFEWPTREQWRAGQRYGFCWLPSR